MPIAINVSYRQLSMLRFCSEHVVKVQHLNAANQLTLGSLLYSGKQHGPLLGKTAQDIIMPTKDGQEVLTYYDKREMITRSDASGLTDRVSQLLAVARIKAKRGKAQSNGDDAAA